MKIEYRPHKNAQIVETPHSVMERFRTEFISLLQYHRNNPKIVFHITLEAKE